MSRNLARPRAMILMHGALRREKLLNQYNFDDVTSSERDAVTMMASFLIGVPGSHMACRACCGRIQTVGDHLQATLAESRRQALKRQNRSRDAS